MKDSLGPLKALLIASVINGVGDVVLCTFLGYGIAGAAWATAVSQVCLMHLSFLLFCILMCPASNAFVIATYLTNLLCTHLFPRFI